MNKTLFFTILIVSLFFVIACIYIYKTESNNEEWKGGGGMGHGGISGFGRGGIGPGGWPFQGRRPGTSWGYGYPSYYNYPRYQYPQYPQYIEYVDRKTPSINVEVAIEKDDDNEMTTPTPTKSLF